MENNDIPVRENDEENRKNSSDDNNDSDDNDNDDDGSNCAEDPNANAEEITCLFCNETFTIIPIALDHIKRTHSIDFAQLKSTFKMDQYSFIKLINCIRTENISSEQLKLTKEPFWIDDKYLKPKCYEPWLTFDYDEIIVETENNDAEISDDNISNNKSYNYYVERLENIIKEQSQHLRLVSEDIIKMRESFKRIVSEQDTLEPDSSKRYSTLSFDACNREHIYFDSYSHFGIHHDMLADTVRTQSYRDAINNNSEFFKSKEVLDVGCGTAILSIFAAKAGANKVVGIDNSIIIYDAMDIVKNNKIENIHLVKGRLEDTELPQDKYDIIISEWMGYFLLFEGMLDTIIYARNRHLKPDGVLLPNRCCLQLAGYGNEVLYKEQIEFWRNVYDVDMSSIIDKFIQEPYINVVDAKYILTETNCIADIDVMKADLNYANFTYNLEMKCIKDGVLSAFVGYFDVFFDLPNAVMFTSSPTAPSTHWKQVVFYLKHPHTITAGEIIKGQIKCRRNVSDARSLVIDIEVFENKCSYYLD